MSAGSQTGLGAVQGSSPKVGFEHFRHGKCDQSGSRDVGTPDGFRFDEEILQMRPLVIFGVLLAAPSAHAFEAVATVVNVAPVNETVSQPQQHCWTEYQQSQVRGPDHNYGGAILGGITGGL